MAGHMYRGLRRHACTQKVSVSPQAPVPLGHDAYLHVHDPAVDPSVPIPLRDEVDVTQRGGLQIPEEG